MFNLSLNISYIFSNWKLSLSDDSVSLTIPNWQPSFSHTYGTSSLLLLIATSTPCFSLLSKIPDPSEIFYQTVSHHSSSLLQLSILLLVNSSHSLKTLSPGPLSFSSITPITMLGDFKTTNNPSNTLASQFL